MNELQEKPDQERPSFLKLLPHFATAIVGLLALAELLQQYGPSATLMINHIIEQLQSFSPYKRYATIHYDVWSYIIYNLWDFSGIPAIIAAISSGAVGILILLGSLGLLAALQSLWYERKLPLGERVARLAIVFPFAFPQYSVVAKYVLLAVFSVFGAFLSTAIALICSLAGIFLGMKALSAPLEVMHAIHSAKTIQKTLRKD